MPVHEFQRLLVELEPDLGGDDLRTGERRHRRLVEGHDLAVGPRLVEREERLALTVGMLVALYALLTRTRIGLVIQAALKHPEMVEALGHNVPRVFMLVFGGGAALAGLAGVIGGNTYVTEPAMAGSVGSIIFVVVVVGGM